jgi:hypothetical protein
MSNNPSTHLTPLVDTYTQLFNSWILLSNSISSVRTLVETNKPININVFNSSMNVSRYMIQKIILDLHQYLSRVLPESDLPDLPPYFITDLFSTLSRRSTKANVSETIYNNTHNTQASPNNQQAISNIITTANSGGSINDHPSSTTILQSISDPSTPSIVASVPNDSKSRNQPPVNPDTITPAVSTIDTTSSNRAISNRVSKRVLNSSPPTIRTADNLL